MDFDLPEELQILRNTVRRFVDKELIPLEREYRHDSEGAMPERLLKPLQEKTKSMGLWMLDVPAEYGGAGLGLLPRCIIHEEIARAASLPFRGLELFGPEVRPVLFHCNEEQKERLLKPVLRGEIRFCFAQTEPDAGSDPAAMRTRAVQEGDCVHYQRHQTLHHRGGAFRLCPVDGRNRSGETCPRRYHLLCCRSQEPRRHPRTAVANDDGRSALADSLRKRPCPGG